MKPFRDLLDGFFRSCCGHPGRGVKRCAAGANGRTGRSTANDPSLPPFGAIIHLAAER
jgi:hypothetical protein